MFKKIYLRHFKYLTGNLKIISPFPLKTKIVYIIHPLVTDRLMTQISIILEDLAITILYIDDDNTPINIQAIKYEG